MPLPDHTVRVFVPCPRCLSFVHAIEVRAEDETPLWYVCMVCAGFAWYPRNSA